MNKSELKKLSKSELINLLLKQEKKKPVPAPRNIKPIPAPRTKKPKKAYNLDNLLEDDPFPNFIVKDNQEETFV